MQVIRELRDTQKGLYEGNPAFLEKLELLKHELSTNDFICSEEVYSDIRLKKNQSLKEYIQCKVYEILHIKNRQIGGLEKQLQDSQSNLVSIK